MMGYVCYTIVREINSRFDLVLSKFLMMLFFWFEKNVDMLNEIKSLKRIFCKRKTSPR